MANEGASKQDLIKMEEEAASGSMNRFADRIVAADKTGSLASGSALAKQALNFNNAWLGHKDTPASLSSFSHNMAKILEADGLSLKQIQENLSFSNSKSKSSTTQNTPVNQDSVPSASVDSSASS